jgi:MFS family permease
VEALSEAPSGGRARAFHALRSRDFRLLWSGQTVSLIGNAAFFVAIGWRTQALTGSSRSLALVLMLYSLAMLATLLIGGALADRYERRTLMIVSDLSRLVVVAALAIVDASGHLSLALLLAFAVAVGLGDGFFHPAFGGIVPLVVEQPLLASANALIGISRNGSFVVGPALAAGIYGGAGSATVFAIDAASFAVSAGLLWLARPRRSEKEPGEGTVREIVAGIRYVAGVPWLWVTIGLAAFVLMIAMAPYQSLLPKLVEDHFDRGVGAYGVLFSLQALGMVLGTIVFGQTNPRRHRVVVTYVAFALNDLCVIGMALTGMYALAAALVGVRGIFIGYGIGIWETVLMELVPESMLSRVISLDFFGSLGLTPVGYALTAVVSDLFSPSQILVVGFAASAVLWLAPLGVARVREAA